MSSIEHPSVPRTPPPEEVEANHEGRGQSETAGSVDRPDANSSDVDADFLDNHLRSPPTFSATKAMKENIKTIKSAGSTEKNMYGPLASLLTSMSEALYGSSRRLLYLFLYI
ncbi:hypothetical protein BD310DRAFT_808522 [Dichomitus squalens]|uniref:Uncharacterized protein n=1 Tax=Dichomitus squalens TaxID=114155 RepID=A0A4Q9Q849_9APHY|nr:hypothetical protein BD310DRAFT_808522 [Dichomitus squalens]